MTFIAELMPEEAKACLPFDVHVSYDGAKPTLWKWAVDKENDAYIVLSYTEGGGYEGTDLEKTYILSWRGNLCLITGKPQPKTFTENGVIMNWLIIRIETHKECLIPHAELIPIIKSAFRGIGHLFDGEEHLDVVLKFPPIEYITVSNRW